MKTFFFLVFIVFTVEIRPQTETTDKWLYVGAVSLALTYGGMVDAMVWDPSIKKEIPDALYLGGFLVSITTLAITASNFETNTLDFTVTTSGAILIGSVLWDGVFSTLKYNDWFYPVPKWYESFGFRNKGQRIMFDLIRIIAGVALLSINLGDIEVNYNKENLSIKI